MRYVVAMIFAIVATAVFMTYVSPKVATWGVAKMAFDSPDGNNDMEALLFMATNFVGLVLGWTVGWIVAGPLSDGQRPQE